MIGNQFAMLDAMQVQELSGDARILAGDHVGASQDIERAERDVGGIADRRRDDIKAVRKVLLRFTRFGRAATVTGAASGID